MSDTHGLTRSVLVGVLKHSRALNGQYELNHESTPRIKRVLRSATGHANGKRKSPVTLATKPFDYQDLA